MIPEKETFIIQTKKNEKAFKKYKNTTLIAGLSGITFLIGFFSFLSCGLNDGYIFACIGSITSILFIGSMMLFLYLRVKIPYSNIFWTITSKGLFLINYKTQDETFIPTNHISSVTQIRETIQIVN